MDNAATMKIVQLDIQGFRSLKNVSWRPGDLNVVIGPNGSGKSNLLRMLELISASAQGKLNDYVTSEGGINAIIWDGEAKRIQFLLNYSPMEELPYFTGYLVRMLRIGRTGSYRLEREDMSTGNTVFTRRDKEAFITQADKAEGVSLNDSIIEGETLLPQLAAPIAGYKSIQMIQSRFEDWSIYQDIRTDQNAPVRQAPVSRLEQRVAPDGQNLINVLHTLYTSDRKFKQDINDAMFAAFGEDFDELIFGPAGDQRIQMRLRWKTLKRDQPTADLSDGTLRFLFLLTVLASPNPPPLIAIDEPETGLHPSMLPIITEYAAEAATRTQVIFTTHSDQFLSAFRDTRPTVTVAKWENGETTLTTLDDGELAYWLRDYSLGKLFRSGELENMAS